MTSHHLTELRGFLEHYYEEFQEYLGTGDLALPPEDFKQQRILSGAHEAEEIFDGLCEAISFTQDLGL